MNSHQRRVHRRWLFTQTEHVLLTERLTGNKNQTSGFANALFLLENNVGGIRAFVPHEKARMYRWFNWCLVGCTTKMPYGLEEVGPRMWDATCCVCKNKYAWEHKVSEFDFRFSYCGGSPRCCP